MTVALQAKMLKQEKLTQEELLEMARQIVQENQNMILSRLSEMPEKVTDAEIHQLDFVNAFLAYFD